MGQLLGQSWAWGQGRRHWAQSCSHRPSGWGGREAGHRAEGRRAEGQASPLLPPARVKGSPKPCEYPLSIRRSPLPFLEIIIFYHPCQGELSFDFLFLQGEGKGLGGGPATSQGVLFGVLISQFERIFSSCLAVSQTGAQHETKLSKEGKGYLSGKEHPVASGMEAKCE